LGDDTLGASERAHGRELSMSVGQDGGDVAKAEITKPEGVKPEGAAGAALPVNVGEGGKVAPVEGGAKSDVAVKAEGAAKPSVVEGAREEQSLGTASGAPGLPVTTTQAVAGCAMLLGVLLIGCAVKQKLSGGGKKVMRAAAPVAWPQEAEMLRDIRELTDRLANELDAKAERLEKLLKAAEQRANALQTLPAQHRIVETKPEVRRGAAGGPTAADGPYREVYDLADQGLSVLEIAQRLDKPTGQVGLILNLRKGTVAL
jgi:hypothetical protein